MSFFGNKQARSLNIYLNGHKLSQIGTNFETKTIKFLGVYMDDKLNWEYHIEKVKSKVRSIIHLLTTVKKSFPPNLKILLYKALLMPHINYCLPIYGSGKGIGRLATYMKWGIRVCNNLKYNSHTNSSFRYYKILKFEDLYSLQMLLLGYKYITKSLTPNYYDSDLTFHAGKIGKRTSSKK